MENKLEQKSIVWDLVWTFLTLGLWSIYLQWRQIRDLNILYNDDSKYSFIWMVLLTILTLGLYFIYHEYRMCVDINLKLKGNPERFEAFLLAFASLIGFWIIVDAYQQSLLNICANKQI